MSNIKAKIAAIREALPGVTPGPWDCDGRAVLGIEITQECCGNWRCEVNEGGEPIGEPYCCGKPVDRYERFQIADADPANSAYLARLDPQTIAAILERYERMEKALGDPDMARVLADQLSNGQQADMDGTMVLVSRQACEEAAEMLRARKVLEDNG